MQWLKSILNDVIEASVELTSQYESSFHHEEQPEQNTGIKIPEKQIEQKNQDKKNEEDEEEEDKDREEKIKAYEGRNPIQLGITPLLKEYVRNLTQHPQTWLDFPVVELTKKKNNKKNKPFKLSNKEEAHALKILQEVPELNELRYNISPRYISDDNFWQIYFLLISNKFHIDDSDDLLSMPELQKSENSLMYNKFVMEFGIAEKEKETKKKKIDIKTVPGLGTTGKEKEVEKETRKIILIRDIYSITKSDSSEFFEIFKNKNEINLENIQEDQFHDNLWWKAHKNGNKIVKYQEEVLKNKEKIEIPRNTHSNWEKVNLIELRQDRPKIFKLLLRSGVPDDQRNKCWLVAPFSSTFSIKNDEFIYLRDCYSIFGNQVPVHLNPVPSFGGNLSFYQFHFLAPSSFPSLRRILTLLALSFPSIHFAPVIVDFGLFFFSFCLLLPFPSLPPSPSLLPLPHFPLSLFLSSFSFPSVLHERNASSLLRNASLGRFLVSFFLI